MVTACINKNEQHSSCSSHVNINCPGSLPEGKPTSWPLCGIAFRGDVKSNLVIQNKRSLLAVIQSLDSGEVGQG
ncbi:hypothetical protein Tco_0079324 [Tanacetum coccineum]